MLASSSHVYAPVAAKSPMVNEDAPLGPARGYGKTKLAAERLAGRLARELGVELVIARGFQQLGPRQMGPMMLAEWIEQIVSGSEPLEVQTRRATIDVCDVRDAARAYRLLALRGDSTRAYNIGNGMARTSGDVLDALLGAVDSPPTVWETHPVPKQDPIADVTRLRATTGWQPTVALETTVADALRWRISQCDAPA
ncbi:MAG: NAD(P)-dependent oxidoreductase [Pirellulales bacterium]